MGTDIHSIAQIKKGKKWITVEASVGGDDRDYDSFAVMANVRNGVGFAGVATGEGWVPIDDPRGLPEDLKVDNQFNVECPPFNFEWTKENEGYEKTQWLGEHSHSWLLLSEIEEYIKKVLKKTYTRTGIVDRYTFERIQSGKLEAPERWCGGITGPNIVTVSEEDARSGVSSTHVSMSWKESALDCLYTLKNYVKELQKIADENKLNHDDIRLVFGFDS